MDWGGGGGLDGHARVQTEGEGCFTCVILKVTYVAFKFL